MEFWNRPASSFQSALFFQAGNNVRRGARLSGIVVFALIAVSGAGCGGSEPSENDLRSHLAAHRAEYEQLRNLVAREPALRVVFRAGVDIDGNGTGARSTRNNSNQKGIAEKRLVEVRRLMDATGTATIHVVAGVIEFEFWQEPGGLKGQAVKGIAYAPRPPSPLIASVDGPLREKAFHAGAHRVYAKLDAKWFAFYLFGD